MIMVILMILMIKEVDGDDNGAHPPHVFQAQCDRVVPVLVFAILVCLPAENKDIADDVFIHHFDLRIHLLSKSSIKPLSW